MCVCVCANISCSSLTSLWSSKYIFQIYIFPTLTSIYRPLVCICVCVCLCAQYTSIWVCLSTCITAYLCVCFHRPPGMFSYMKSLPHAAELWCFHQVENYSRQKGPFQVLVSWPRQVHGTTVRDNSPHPLNRWLGINLVNGPLLYCKSEIMTTIAAMSLAIKLSQCLGVYEYKLYYCNLFWATRGQRLSKTAWQAQSPDIPSLHKVDMATKHIPPTLWCKTHASGHSY